MFAVVLALFEVTLSFDNAILNAKILQTLSPRWQARFLTWGMLFAVFGVRLLLPICIVSLVSSISPIALLWIAIDAPAYYAQLIAQSHHVINAFGVGFLIMVALTYFFDEEKSEHWVRPIERHLVQWGRVAYIEIIIACVVIGLLSYVLPDHHIEIVMAGGIGIIMYVCMEQAVSLLYRFQRKENTVLQHGLVGFIYLNILDAAFSLDGVVGAFALTTDIVAIVVGLSIGAYAVRSITVYMTRARTLTSVKYLEHGAHWAIFGLALSMALSLVIHIPQTGIALMSIVILATAYYSSVRT
jgi:hypothetical protein